MTYRQFRLCGKGRLESWVWSHQDMVFIVFTVWLFLLMFTW